MDITPQPITRRRARAAAVGALALATALIGVAAGGRTAPPAGPGSGALRFAAPSAGPVRFSGQLDKGAVLVGQDGRVRMELLLAAPGQEAVAAPRVPTDVVVILDRSGSMAGEKMAQARAAVRELAGQLAGDDRFALVTYADGAELAIPLARLGSEAQAGWRAAVNAIQPGGQTNMASGLDLGLDVVERSRTPGRVARMILVSDGLANQGDASHEGLVRRAGRAAAGEFMLTTVGVGEDFNEYLMTALADAGTGNYYYLEGAADLASVLAREFDAARATVASGLAVHIAPGPGVRVLEAAGYPLEATAAGVAFRPGSLFAGQERRIWVTLAVSAQGTGEHDLGRFSLAYVHEGERATLTFAEVPRVVSVASEDDFFARIDVPAWTRSVVVDGYNKVKEEVAREVKAGRRDAALDKLRRFRAESEALNARVQSPAVQQGLESLRSLDADVKAAFEGDDQAARQNKLSKAASAAALDERRAGSKQAVAP
jgi:Ca-activated chloride channel family protein